MSANKCKLPIPAFVSVKHLFILSDPSGTNILSCQQGGSECIIDFSENLERNTLKNESN